jgi:hypothetical protein
MNFRSIFSKKQRIIKKIESYFPSGASFFLNFELEGHKADILAVDDYGVFLINILLDKCVLDDGCVSDKKEELLELKKSLLKSIKSDVEIFIYTLVGTNPSKEIEDRYGVETLFDDFNSLKKKIDKGSKETILKILKGTVANK